MFVISEQQMRVFRVALEAGHEDRIFEHACSTYPDPSRLLGPECIRALVRLAIKRAADYMLVSVEAHRLIFRLILECGINFDSDPVLDFPGPILTSHSAERLRIAQLASAADQYSAKTAPGLRSAALNFRNFRTVWPGGLSNDEYLRELCHGCTTLFPQKATLVRDHAWLALSQSATAAASERGWSTPTAHAVLFALFFLAGAGLLDDPRFAFISSVTPDAPADPGVVLLQTAGSHFERWFARSE
jgi:hypothetical protein